jgi:hypothetical protein
MEHNNIAKPDLDGFSESTNSRVQNFSLLTLFVLIGLGAWQVCFPLQALCIVVLDADAEVRSVRRYYIYDPSSSASI